MRRILPIIMTTALLSAAVAAPATNPLLQPWKGPYGGVPPFDVATPALLVPALEDPNNPNADRAAHTVLELADVDQGLSELAARLLGEIEAAFAQCFEAAIECSRLPAGSDPAELARFIMTVNQGLRVASRKNTSKREIAGILDTTLSLMGVAA